MYPCTITTTIINLENSEYLKFLGVAKYLSQWKPRSPPFPQPLLTQAKAMEFNNQVLTGTTNEDQKHRVCIHLVRQLSVI